MARPRTSRPVDKGRQAATNEPAAVVGRFTDGVFRLERSTGEGTGALDVAERILMRLDTGLGPLIGAAGFDVLVARALALATRAHPALEGLRAGRGGKLSRGDSSAPEGEAQRAGARAIVAELIMLLWMLIGEDLAMRLVRDAWPRAAREKK